MFPRRARQPRRPLLLLDVDGVFNPLSDGLLPGFEVHAGAYDNFAVNPTHGQWVRDLSAMFEVMWATAREDEANFDVGPSLGLPVLPFITFTRSWDSETTWKMHDVAVTVGDRPFCWIDDELHADALAWAASRAQPTLLLTPDPRIGLTAEHRDAMVAFAGSCSA
jgi:hypothetical protein